MYYTLCLLGGMAFVVISTCAAPALFPIRTRSMRFAVFFVSLFAATMVADLSCLSHWRAERAEKLHEIVSGLHPSPVLENPVPDFLIISLPQSSIADYMILDSPWFMPYPFWWLQLLGFASAVGIAVSVLCRLAVCDGKSDNDDGNDDSNSDQEFDPTPEPRNQVFDEDRRLHSL